MDFNLTTNPMEENRGKTGQKKRRGGGGVSAAAALSRHF
jgi:hypothetical protein